MNDAGRIILGVCLEKGLFVAKTMFCHRRIHAHIYESKKDRSMLDLFLMGKAIPDPIMNMKAYRDAKLETDHYLVITRIKGVFASWCQRVTCP